MNRTMLRTVGSFVVVAGLLAGLVFGGITLAKQRNNTYAQQHAPQVATNNQPQDGTSHPQQSTPQEQPKPQPQTNTPAQNQPGASSSQGQTGQSSTAQPQQQTQTGQTPQSTQPSQTPRAGSGTGQVPSTGPDQDLVFALVPVMAAIYLLLVIKQIRGRLTKKLLS